MAEPQIRTVPSLPGRGGRTRLREFQAGLAERLRHAAAAPSLQRRLAVRIGQEHRERNFLIDLPEAGEIISIPEITPVPLTKSWYRGLANVRGSLVSDFNEDGATLLDKDSRVLAFSSRLHFNAAIFVTRMLGLRNAAQLTRVDRDDESARAPWIGDAFQDADGVIWEELRLVALASDERFLQIGIR